MSITTISTSGTIGQTGAIITFTPTIGSPFTLDFTTPGVTINTGATVKLSSDLSFNATSQYFIIGSNSVTFDGSGNKIVINTIANYPGVFKCAIDAYSATIQNLGVTVNTSSVSTLLTINGWVVQGYSTYSGFDANIIVSNCYSTGNTTTTSGCIFGQYSSGTATNCYSTGNISGNSAGGIFGSRGTSATATNCYSTGNISTGSIGGIFGATSTSCIATNCYSTGNISGANTGGIFGNTSTSCIATNCYSTGTMSVANSGGIFGKSASNCIANYCYSTGNSSSTDQGGIFSNTSIDCSANYCYSTGSITSTGGGIFGDYNNRGTATNCYSTGTIISGGGGIFVSSSPTAGTAVNCYCIGGTNIGGYINNNCIGVSGTWLDVSANETIDTGTSGLVWTDISTEVNVPWLLSSYNQAIYDPSFETFTESIDSYTANGIYGSTTVYGGSSISPTYQIMSSTTPTKNIPTFSTATGGLTFTHPEGTYTYNILCYYTYNSAKVGYNFSAYTLTAPIPCFLLGTKIKVSPTEYKLIQDLKEGDFVYTSDERVVPILKINHYNVLPNPLSSPYIIPEGYRYGEFVCDQDLYLSPEHAVLIDSDKLVPVKALGFQQDTTLTDLTYFHITLPNLFTDHLVANGIPCESYAGESALQSSGNYISMYFNHEIFKKVYDKQHFIRKNLTFEKYNRIVESTTINLPIPLKALPTYEIIPSGVDFNFAELI